MIGALISFVYMHGHENLDVLTQQWSVLKLRGIAEKIAERLSPGIKEKNQAKKYESSVTRKEGRDARGKPTVKTDNFTSFGDMFKQAQTGINTSVSTGGI